MNYNSVTTVYELDLSTAFDISTATYNSNNYDTTAETANAQGVTFNPGETIMYVIDSTENVFQYTLSTAGDITSASYASKTLDASSQVSIGNGLDFSDSGFTLNIIDSATNVETYTLTTAYDLSTASCSSRML